MKVLFVLSAVFALAAAGRVDINFLSKVQQGAVSEGIIELPQTPIKAAEESATLQAMTGLEKRSALVSMLTELTSAAQAPFVAKLTEMGLTFQTYWISNIILVKGLTVESVLALGDLQGDFIIREQFYASINAAIFHGEAKNVSQQNQWGVDMIGSPQCWAAGHRGEGVNVVIIDTGVNVGHVALAEGYSGAWADPYYSTAGPTDQHGHGSHCAGTIGGRANGVGVAPAAQWSGCRGLNHQGSGSEANLNFCGQHAVTATPTIHVASNSWGGGSGQTWYNPTVSAWRQANITPVFAQGNSGAACRTANSPGDQPNLIGVGATTSTDTMATFSSRGPSSAGLLKPEVSAPGNQIVSCGTGANNYVTMSGTSMACPHTAGAVAIIRGRHPTWNYDQVLSHLTMHTDKPTLTAADRNCGLPTPGQDFPNHAWGHGRIHVGKGCEA